MRSGSEVSTRPLAFWLSCAVGTIALDQLTKWLVLAKFREGERMNLLPFFGWSRRVAKVVLHVACDCGERFHHCLDA
jgi:hypothetical protein